MEMLNEITLRVIVTSLPTVIIVMEVVDYLIHRHHD